MSGYTISYEYLVKDLLSPGLRKMARSMKNMGQSSRAGTSGVNNLSRSFKNAGRNAAAAEHRIKRLAKTIWALRMTGGGLTSLGLTGFMGGYPIARTIKQYANYEDALISIRKVWTGQQKDYDKIVSSLKELNAQIPLSREAIAGLMEEGIRAKVSSTDDPQEYLDFTRLAAKFMVAFNLSATEAPQILAKLKSQLGLTTREFEEFGDTLNTVANSFSTNEREMLEGMKRVGGLAKSLAGMQGVNDASAILGAQMAAGTPKEVAATGLRTLIARLSTQPSTTKKALGNLGLDAKQIKKDLPNDLFGTVYKVLRKISELKPEDRAGTLSLLAGMKSFDAFARLLSRADLLKQVKDVVDGDFRLTMNSEFERRLKGLNSLLEITRNIIQDTADSLVVQWRGSIAKGLATIQKWTKSMDGSKILGWAAGLVAVFSALSLVIVPLGIFAFSLKAILPMLALLVSPMSLLVAAAVGLALAFSNTGSAFNSFKNSIAEKWDTSELKSIFNEISDLATSLTNKLSSQLPSVLQALASDNPLARMFRGALDIATQIIGLFAKLPDFILNPKSALSGLAKAPVDGLRKIKSWLPDFSMPNLTLSKDRRDLLSGKSLARSEVDKQTALNVRTETKVDVSAPPSITLKGVDGRVHGSIPLTTSSDKGRTQVDSAAITTP